MTKTIHNDTKIAKAETPQVVHACKSCGDRSLNTSPFFPGDLPTSYGPSAAGRSQRQPFFYDQRHCQTSEWPSCDSIPLDSLRSPVNTLVRKLNTVGPVGLPSSIPYQT